MNPFRGRSGPRTQPTSKPLVAMNRRNLKSWELYLGLPQVVILLGIVTGSIASAFALGYLSGQRVGFDSARQIDLSGTSRLPIPETPELSDESISKVYARLKDTTPPASLVEEEPVSVTDAKADPPRTLEPIRSGEEAPMELEVPERIQEINPRATKLLDSLLEEAGVPSKEETADVVEETVEVSSDSELNEISEGALTLNTEMPETEVERIEPGVPDEPVVDPAVRVISPGRVVEKTETDIIKEIVSDKKVEPEVKPEQEVVTKKEEPSVQKQTSQTSKFMRAKVIRGWYAQVAAPRNLKDADTVASKLRGSGFPVVIESAKIGGQEYFRVLVGPEDSKELGSRLVSQLKRERGLRGSPFLKRVG